MLSKLPSPTVAAIDVLALTSSNEVVVPLFQNKPELTTDVDCDTWDVDEGEVLQISNPISVSIEEISSQLGNWKESLID